MDKIIKYEVTEDSFFHKKDDIVYSCPHEDYKLCGLYKFTYGGDWQFVTRNKDGSYPGWVIETRKLKMIEEML
jgi:hypothetical protein